MFLRVRGLSGSGFLGEVFWGGFLGSEGGRLNIFDSKEPVSVEDFGGWENILGWKAPESVEFFSRVSSQEP